MAGGRRRPLWCPLLDLCSCSVDLNTMYPTLVLTDGREHPHARQGDLDKCHLNSNGEPGGGETCHRKAAKPSSMTMLSGPAVIVSRAAARTTAVIVIGPAAAVVDTNFFCHRPTPRRVGRIGTVFFVTTSGVYSPLPSIEVSPSGASRSGLPDYCPRDQVSHRWPVGR